MIKDHCDNCDCVPTDERGKVDWIKVGKYVFHERGHGGPPGMPPQLAAMLGGGNPEPHVCLEGEGWDFCTAECAASFILGGFKPNLQPVLEARVERIVAAAAFQDDPPPADQ